MLKNSSYIIISGTRFKPRKNIYNYNINFNGIQIYYNNKNNLIFFNNYVVFIDGNIFVDNKNIKKHEILLFRLLDKYKDSNYLANISGDFNLFIWDKSTKELSVISSHFGMKPLNFTRKYNCYLFSNRAINIVNFLGEYKTHLPSLLEYLLYNYYVSNYTLIEQIELFPPASIGEIRLNNKMNINNYWDLKELFNSQYISSNKKSRQLIDDVLNRVIKKYIDTDSTFGLSLTGGWDGRLILSYLLKNNIDNFFLYSFGTRESPDIKIPRYIANQLGIEYYPFYLNENYFNKYFLSMSQENLIQTDGLRGFQRAHYYYAIKNVGKRTDKILSGNCASNIIKYANRKPSDVYNTNLVELIFSNNKKDTIMKQQKLMEQHLRISIPKKVKEETIEQVANSDIYLPGYSKSQLFYKVLLQNIERKYYGYEMMGYSDFVDNLSPFIDIDFIKALSKTNYFGAHHDYDDRSLKSRWMSSILYAKLIKKNSSLLGSFISDRGFSTNEILTISGMIKVYKKKFSKSRSNIERDYYGMSNAYHLILKYIDSDIKTNFPLGVDFKSLKKYNIYSSMSKNVIGNYLSFLIWIDHVTKN